MERNRELLKPPVGNRVIEDGELKVMIVAGPNQRSDYHVEEGEEWFYQIQGNMILRVVDDGAFYDVTIAEGHTFCLPARVPHSPQREPNSIGIVVERRRRPGEVDALQWYCQNEECGEVVYRTEFFCESLDKMGDILAGYYEDEDKRKCKACGVVDEPPQLKC